MWFSGVLFLYVFKGRFGVPFFVWVFYLCGGGCVGFGLFCIADQRVLWGFCISLGVSVTLCRDPLFPVRLSLGGIFLFYLSLALVLLASEFGFAGSMNSGQAPLSLRLALPLWCAPLKVPRFW